jgi:hypothetical protein
MTKAAISPLPRRMIEDMTVRNFVEKTQKDYIRHVKNLTAFLGRSPGSRADNIARVRQLLAQPQSDRAEADDTTTTSCRSLGRARAAAAA